MEVYASEQNSVGTWAQIGYKDPSGSATGGSTANFTYSSGTAGTDDWKATSTVGLNDCQVGSAWFLGTVYTSASGNVTSTPGFTAVGSGCTIDGLTPNFCRIGAGCATTSTTTGG